MSTLHFRSLLNRNYADLAALYERAAQLLIHKGIQDALVRDAVILLEKSRKLAMYEKYLLEVEDPKSETPLLPSQYSESLAADQIMFTAESLEPSQLLALAGSLKSLSAKKTRPLDPPEGDARGRDNLTTQRQKPGMASYIAEANRLSHQIKDLRYRAQILMDEASRFRDE